jgi:methylated-DNA-[protein]-cysteine S-methyltransferase
MCSRRPLFWMSRELQGHGRQHLLHHGEGHLGRMNPELTMTRKVRMPAAKSCFAYYDSPIGLIEVSGTPEGITSLFFVEERRPGVARNDCRSRWMEPSFNYRCGRNSGTFPSDRRFRTGTSPDPSASPVPCARSGRPTAIIPSRSSCPVTGSSEVIGSDGGLTGYGGGLERKQWLLKHEGGLLL